MKGGKRKFANIPVGATVMSRMWVGVKVDEKTARLMCALGIWSPQDAFTLEHKCFYVRDNVVHGVEGFSRWSWRMDDEAR